MTNPTNMGCNCQYIPFRILRTPFASDAEHWATGPMPACLPQIARTTLLLPHGKMATLSIKPECQSVSFSMSKAHAQTPPQTMPTNPAPSVVIPPMAQLAAPQTELGSVLYIHMTPYISDGWHCMLYDLDISHLFPLLVNNIVYGSPIDNPPPL